VAIDKHCSCNWHISRQTNFVLLYPDGQPVKSDTLGSEEPFTLASYRDFMSKSFQKLVLFLCDQNHFAAGKKLYFLQLLALAKALWL